jgi:hypothetical protein
VQIDLGGVGKRSEGCTIFGGMHTLPHPLSIVIIKVVLQCFNNQNSKIQNFYLLVWKAVQSRNFFDNDHEIYIYCLDQIANPITLYARCSLDSPEMVEILNLTNQCLLFMIVPIFLRSVRMTTHERWTPAMRMNFRLR